LLRGLFVAAKFTVVLALGNDLSCLQSIVVAILEFRQFRPPSLCLRRPFAALWSSLADSIAGFTQAAQ
jgi:hypothetical protein